MIGPPAKVAAYALGLAVVFGGAFGIGGAVGPVADRPVAQAAQAAGVATTDAPAEPDILPGGLQVSQNGYTGAEQGAEQETKQETGHEPASTGHTDEHGH